jgi:type IV pilus assembly protein PilB
MDMGIPNYLVASATRLIMAQRMVKKICPKCKEEVNLSKDQVEALKAPPELLRGLRAFRGKGCSACGDTGKSGRTGIYEVMPITPKIENLILQKSSDSDIREAALEDGMFPLRMCAIEKMKNGVISIDEVFATTTSS